MSSTGKKRLRIAFLTPEFVTDLSGSGGLASYLSRMVRVLQSLGHEPEVFCASEESAVLDYRGARVEHVIREPGFRLKVVRKLVYMTPKLELPKILLHVPGADALARSLEHRHRQKPFDLVQTSTHGLTGLFLRRRSGRCHVMRCTSLHFMTRCTDGTQMPPRFDDRAIDWLERRSMRRADLVYAPSRFLAEHFRREHGVNVHVLRPPFFLEAEPAEQIPYELPERYLVHFGFLGPRKGSDLLAQALQLAWREVPDLRMVWAGKELPAGSFAQYQQIWKERADRVHWLGPLPKPELYGVVRADAAVFPSRIDNLPNTVIESLLLGVPVIGSDGVSIDELVESGRSGELVPVGDVPALARAMIKVWRRDVTWAGSRFRCPAILDETSPEDAGRNLLRLAGLVNCTG